MLPDSAPLKQRAGLVYRAELAEIGHRPSLLANWFVRKERKPHFCRSREGVTA